MKVDKSDKAIDNMSYKKYKEDKQKDNGIMMAGKVTSFDFKNFSKYYDNVYKKGVSVKKIFPDGLSNKVLQQFLDKANKLSKNKCQLLI